MKSFLISMALVLGTTATFAQINEETLRDLENVEKIQSQEIKLKSNGVDTLKIVADNKVYTFIDSVSIKDVDKKFRIKKDDINNTLVITLSDSDSTIAWKNDINVKINDITITHDSTEYNNIDTTIIRIGNRRIVFINDEDNSYSIKIPNNDDDFDFDIDIDDDDFFDDSKGNKKNYRFHFNRYESRTWGFEFGINGFMDNANSMVMSNDLDWLDLKQARSWNFNLNLWEHFFALGTPHVGLVTGMGFSFNNYHFSNSLTLKVENGITVPDSTYFNTPIRRTKLSTFGFDIPLLLEFRIPVNSHGTINCSAGVIGEVRIASKTKVVYDLDGDKRKVRNGSDYNMTTLKYYLTARIGFDDTYIFANYSPIQLFENNKGPEVYPFSIGIGFAL